MAIQPACKIEDCTFPSKSLGWCSMHYSRWRRGVSAKEMLEPPTARRGRVAGNAEERFWSRIEKTETCWLWKSEDKSPYGKFHHDGKVVLAHRFSYELRYGIIPTGLVVDHLCLVKSCVNPIHLEVVTIAENTARANISREKPSLCKRGHSLEGANRIQTGVHSAYCQECNRQQQKALRVKQQDLAHAAGYVNANPTGKAAEVITMLLRYFDKGTSL